MNALLFLSSRAFNFCTMRNTLLLIILLCSCRVFAQVVYLRDHLLFDTIVDLKLEYKPQQYVDDLSFNLIDDKLFVVGSNKATNYDFAFSIHGAGNKSLQSSFKLPNSFGMEGFVGFDVKENIYAVLSYYGWHVYSLTEKDTTLINSYQINLRKESKNSFTEIKIINDSVICLARAGYMGRLKKNETVQVLFYNFRKAKELNRVTLDFDMPELSYFGPNNRISVTNDGCYIADFDKYHVTHIKWNGESTRVLHIDTLPVHKGLYEKLPKARVDAKAGNNAGPILDLISPYYEDSLFIMNDISHTRDSIFFVRYIMPKSGDASDTLFMNNYIDIWVKEGGGYSKLKTLSDPMEYEFLVNKTGYNTKESYHQPTLATRYKIVGNKIIFLSWSSGLYPIGENKTAFRKKEKQHLATHSAIPVLIIYEIKKSAFTR